tara:strand:- start:104 stop:316 length:213 start_codon:yes stop_codon:yes gene_type:complete
MPKSVLLRLQIRPLDFLVEYSIFDFRLGHPISFVVLTADSARGLVGVFIPDFLGDEKCKRFLQLTNLVSN